MESSGFQRLLLTSYNVTPQGGGEDVAEDHSRAHTQIKAPLEPSKDTSHALSATSLSAASLVGWGSLPLPRIPLPNLQGWTRSRYPPRDREPLMHFQGCPEGGEAALAAALVPAQRLARNSAASASKAKLLRLAPGWGK